MNIEKRPKFHIGLGTIIMIIAFIILPIFVFYHLDYTMLPTRICLIISIILAIIEIVVLLIVINKKRKKYLSELDDWKQTANIMNKTVNESINNLNELRKY